MSDLVERLRNESSDESYNLCCDAADEIELLTEENEKLWADGFKVVASGGVYKGNTRIKKS